MKKLILYSLLLFSALSVSAENFDPAACPDLAVKIYPGKFQFERFAAFAPDLLTVTEPVRKNDARDLPQQVPV